MTKPLMVEIAGPPESGKTTTSKLLADALEARGIKTRLFSEAASMAPFLREFRLCHKFNVWTLARHITDMIEAENSDVQLILLDRGPWDCLYWFRYFVSIGQITHREFANLESFVQWRTIGGRIDLLCLLVCSPDVAISRKGFEGQIVNQTVLPALFEIYKRDYTAHTIRWATDSLSPESLVHDILQNIDERLRESFRVQRVEQLPGGRSSG